MDVGPEPRNIRIIAHRAGEIGRDALDLAVSIRDNGLLGIDEIDILKLDSAASALATLADRLRMARFVEMIPDRETAGRTE